MKIYIHTDLEGISGITEAGQVLIGNEPQNAYAAERLMADVNAAIDGAFAGGAAHVTVVDSHRGGNNFIASMLDPRAVHDLRLNNKWWGTMDDSYDGTLYIGAHAMNGTPNAFLCHTSNLSWHKYRVNGRQFGELAMWATVSGHFGIPMLMVSGDLAACQEAAAFFNPIKTAVVKHAAGIGKAYTHLSNGEAEELIRQTAKDAISLIGQAKPFKPILPMEVKLEFINEWGECRAEKVSQMPGVERLDGWTVRRVADCLLDVFFE